MKTPYQTIKETGMKSSWHSPDGFQKIETFDNGQRFLHDPCIGYPVTMTPDIEQAEHWNHHQALIAAQGTHGQG